MNVIERVLRQSRWLDIALVLAVVTMLIQVRSGVSEINATRFSEIDAIRLCSLDGRSDSTAVSCERLDSLEAWVRTREYVPAKLDSLSAWVEGRQYVPARFDSLEARVKALESGR